MFLGLVLNLLETTDLGEKRRYFTMNEVNPNKYHAQSEFIVGYTGYTSIRDDFFHHPKNSWFLGLLSEFKSHC